MNFIYGFDSLGDKLTCITQTGEYVIRPVLYGEYQGQPTAEPATFEDFDRHGLYIRRDGRHEHIDDFDTVAEAVARAEEQDAY